MTESKINANHHSMQTNAQNQWTNCTTRSTKWSARIKSVKDIQTMIINLFVRQARMVFE